MIKLANTDHRREDSAIEASRICSHIMEAENQKPLFQHPPKDYFVQQDGVEFAGRHLLIDLWGASYLNDLELMEKALRECVECCNATLLHIHLHHFSPSGGISGVAVLAESHISVHTWPERDFAAFDVFMCGATFPERSIEILKNAFQPEKIKVNEKLRGLVV